jgi:hypothetical protein
MTKDEILDTAKQLINGQRAKDYGDAEDNFLRVAQGWNIIVDNSYRTHGRITPKHVALMLDWLKTARLLETINHDDSWVDKVGYTGLGGSFKNTEEA